MEIVIPLVSGIGLLLVGGRIGFALGRAYEKHRAIKFVTEVTKGIAARFGLSDSDLTKHLEAMKKEMS